MPPVATQRLKAISVVDVPSSMAALREMDEGNIDVVVSDIALYSNEPHGVALARMIRTRHPEMPILFVTGISDIDRLETAMPGEVLHKPVEPCDLSRKVEELLA